MFASIIIYFMSAIQGYVIIIVMRLWHQKLIHYLDNKRLLGQHRECCALRGLGWAKKHSVVDYVFKHSPILLYEYHLLVVEEMASRGYQVDRVWTDELYRGKKCPCWDRDTLLSNITKDDLAMMLLYRHGTLDHNTGWYLKTRNHPNDPMLYKKEHDDAYLKECLLNLDSKGAELTNGKTIAEELIALDLHSKAKDGKPTSIT